MFHPGTLIDNLSKNIMSIKNPKSFTLSKIYVDDFTNKMCHHSTEQYVRQVDAGWLKMDLSPADVQCLYYNDIYWQNPELVCYRNIQRVIVDKGHLMIVLTT